MIFAVNEQEWIIFKVNKQAWMIYTVHALELRKLRYALFDNFW